MDKINTAKKTPKTLFTFASLPPKEVKKLSKFIHSSFFTNSKSLPNLLEYLKKHHQGLPLKPLEKRKLFRHLFPDEQFKAKRVLDLLSKFCLLMDQFLVIRKVQSNPILISQLKVEAFGELNLSKRFQKEITVLKKKLDQTSNKDANYDLQMLSLHSQHYFHSGTLSFQVGQTDIADIMKHLDRFYITNKLRYTCELINRSKTLQEENDNILLIEESLELAKKYYQGRYPLIEIYRMMIPLLRMEDYKLFRQLKKLFFSTRNTITLIEQQAIFQYFINITNGRINSGKNKYKQELFELYQLGLKHRLCFSNKKISETTFINICMSSSGLKKNQWTQNFIANNKKHLDKKVKESTLHLSAAVVLFSKGEYIKVLDFLAKVDFLTDRYKLWMRSLKARTLYEVSIFNQTYIMVLQTFLQSFEQFVRSNKVFSESTKRRYLNYIALIKRIKKQAFQLTSEKKKKLKQNILEKDQLIARAWLLEKVEEL